MDDNQNNQQDEILINYDRGKYDKCIYLLNKKKGKEGSVLEAEINENRVNVCHSALAILNNAENAFDTEEKLLAFHQNVTSLGLSKDQRWLELELVALYNVLWWHTHLINDRTNLAVNMSSMQIFCKGLKKATGTCHMKTCAHTIEEITSTITDLQDLTIANNYTTASVILEILVTTLLFVFKFNNAQIIFKSCSQFLSSKLVKFGQQIKAFKALEKFDENETEGKKLFKFGLSKLTLTAADDSHVFEYLVTINSICLFKSNQYKASLQCLKKYSVTEQKGLHLYLCALNCFQLGNLDLSLGFLLKTSSVVIESQLQFRCYILQGKICAKNGDHKSAVQYFKKAKDLEPTSGTAYSCMGQEYGRMGLYNMMVECYQQALRFVPIGSNLTRQPGNIQICLLECLHSQEELTELVVVYSLAMSYGLDERFQDSADTFEKVIQSKDCLTDSADSAKQQLSVPCRVILLHEACAMNLLCGNLSRAEELCTSAMDEYALMLRTEDGQTDAEQEPIFVKDIKWLQTLISDELGLGDILEEPEEQEVADWFENSLHLFEEDVVGLLLLAEIQKVKEAEEYKSTLTKIHLIFSKHLSKVQKNQQEKDKQVVLLVKALAAKYSLNIAKCQMSSKKAELEVERTLKRALTCNQGDKDVLYSYANFLIGCGRKPDAAKLWASFCRKESSVAAEQCHSMALQFLLMTRVTKRQLDKLKDQVECGSTFAQL